MPTRSSGCATCRKRKIRCDESRPRCQRCATHGVSCPGYRTEKPGGLEFKDQTSVTVTKAKEQYKTKALNDSTSPWKITTSRPSLPSSPDSNDGATTNSISIQTQGTSLIPVDEGLTQNQCLVLSDPNSASPIFLPSPELERARLYGEFISTYLPHTAEGAQHGHFSFFQTIALKRSEQPALQQALDALSSVQVGSLYKDKGLLKQAVGKYATALSSLGNSIKRGDFMHDDDVLAAVTVMAACELYEDIASMGEGWANHVKGSNQLVALRGTESLQSELALLLYSNMRHGSLCHALIQRKAPFMAAPEWRKVAFRVPRAIRDSSTLFYDIAIQIPGLLERHDNIDFDSPSALSDIDEILADSDELETKLRDWFAGWQARSVLDGRTIHELHPIADFPTFCALCPDRTFTHAYTFPDFLVAYLHSLHWMAMHFLRSNTQSLHKQRHMLLVNWYPSDDEVVPEEELLGYCLDLCQCMPFFVEPISSSTGSIGIFLPLRCCALYFTAHGHWRWLKWIGSVRNSVFVHGLAPPNVNCPDGSMGDSASRLTRGSPESPHSVASS